MEVFGVMKIKIILILFTAAVFFSCGDDKREPIKKVLPKKTVEVEVPKIATPDYNADSAYKYVEDQVGFGPRVPNTKEHTACAKYLEEKLASFGLNTIVQKGEVTTFNNKKLNIKNIIGEYNPKVERRILLFAHWDSRPFADQDTKNMTKPILGANDGASGVGVLLEVARQLSIIKPNIGVDIIFFDAEDYGQPSSGMTISKSETWCLGSQFWSKAPHKENYKAEYGILLDMVGSKDAYFTKESISLRYAPHVVHKVWETAQAIGHGNHFVNKETFFVGTDDHQYVNEIAGIPSIDIIHYNQNKGSFHDSWHTHADNMDVIDKTSLKAVGETLLAVIFSEK